MSEKQTKDQIRPPVSAEQLKAFRDAYSALTRRTVERGEPAMFVAEGSFTQNPLAITETGIHGFPHSETDIDFKPDGAVESSFSQRDGEATIAWLETYGEKTAYNLGRLGQFATSTSNAVVQDIYTLFPDGNIEQARFTLGGGDPEYGDYTPDKSEHIRWLDAEQTEALAEQIRDI